MTKVLVTESESQNPKADRNPSGIRVIVSDNFQYLQRIEHARHGHNLTPWLRRKESVFVQVPTRLKGATERRLSNAEFAALAAAARTGKSQAATEVRVHALEAGYVVHLGPKGNLSAYRLGSEAELKNLLKRAERQFRLLEVTVISASLLSIHLVHSVLPSQGLMFEHEQTSGFRLPVARPLRSVLVLTNITGADLSHLGQNLAFWSKGISGFRFRHVFGQLTTRRVESSLLGREWDVVIYRGHGIASAEGVFWKLLDKDWLVPPSISPVYIHSSCLSNSDLLPLDRLPATQFITPLSHLADFDDSRLVRLFLERYKVSRQVHSALRAAQAAFSQFVLINTSS